MKYFEENKINKITLKGDENRVFSVEKENESFVFTEECDSYFSEKYSKIHALEMIEELKKWIEKL